MKASKEQVEHSILFFAEKYSLSENYKALFNNHIGLPRIVEMITYEMFLQKFNSYYCSDEEYEYYKIILEYAIELRQNGLVIYQ